MKETTYLLMSPVGSRETLGSSVNAQLKTIDGRDYVVYDQGDVEVRVPFHAVKCVRVPKGEAKPAATKAESKTETKASKKS